MSSRILKFIERKLNSAARRRWSRRVQSVPHLTSSELRGLRSQARNLRAPLEAFLSEAEGRLALPLIGSNAMQLSLYTDWSYRPELWRGQIFPQGAAAMGSKAKLGAECTLFHDCKTSEITFRQIRNSREEDLAPFGLRLDVFRFDGSVLSISIDIADDVCDGLSTRHILRLDCAFELEKPIEVFARLNVQHGPNLEKVVREIPMPSMNSFVEFDLAYTKLNEKRVEKVWVDFIFEDPEMNQIVMRDVTLSRRPRAEL